MDNCEKARHLMALHVADDPSLTAQERKALETHLEICPHCANEYEETKKIMIIVKKYWGPVSEETLRLFREAGLAMGGMTVEQGWEDLKCRIPELAWPERRQKILQFSRRLGTAAAVAASMALIIALGWAILGKSSTQQPLTITKPVQSRAFAELVTPSGRQALPLGQPIMTDDQRQEVMLGGIHLVVINTETSVTFEAESVGEKAKYDLQLAKGELYVEVVPGHQFTIKTPNAQLIITGTKFGVRYQDDQTDLTLVKGSVKFGNNKDQWTDVTAGHWSTVIDAEIPTVPKQVDALAAVAWARQLAMENALANIDPAINEEPSDLIRGSWHMPPPKLEELDYETWIEEKSAWFASQFPWIFKIEKYLKEQDVETDYVTLLMISGDIWQFHYPRPFNCPIATFDPGSINRLARHYDVDPQWLLKTTGFASARTLNRVRVEASHEATAEAGRWDDLYCAAMSLWQSDLEAAAEEGVSLSNELMLFTLQATTYLLNTQTATYLWIKTHPVQVEELLANDEYVSSYLAELFSFPVINQKTWLEFLSELLPTAHNASITTQELFTTPQDPGCSSQSLVLTRQLSDLVTPLALRKCSKDLPLEGGSR